MFDLSAVQILLVLGIALIVVGPKRLPEMGKSLGRGLRGFRDTVSGRDAGDAVAAEGTVEAAPVAATPSEPSPTNVS